MALWFAAVVSVVALPSSTTFAYLDADAAYARGLSYEQGNGRPRDATRALIMYCRADSDGHADAAFAIGRFYALGLGVKRDDAIAAAWFRRAVARGSEDARMYLSVYRGRATRALSCPYGQTWRDAKSLRRAPEQVRALVERLAPSYGLDPQLVLAVIAVESSFQSDAVSSKNAQGLMQLIPATAARFGVADPFDPTENIRGGMAYLRWLLREFRGDVTLAIAAYNAGEGNVQRYKGVPPFAETQRYVKKIRAIYTRAHHPL